MRIQPITLSQSALRNSHDFFTARFSSSSRKQPSTCWDTTVRIYNSIGQPSKKCKAKLLHGKIDRKSSIFEVQHQTSNLIQHKRKQKLMPTTGSPSRSERLSDSSEASAFQYVSPPSLFSERTDKILKNSQTNKQTKTFKYIYFDSCLSFYQSLPRFLLWLLFPFSLSLLAGKREDPTHQQLHQKLS